MWHVETFTTDTASSEACAPARRKETLNVKDSFDFHRF